MWNIVDKHLDKNKFIGLIFINFLVFLTTSFIHMLSITSGKIYLDYIVLIVMILIFVYHLILKLKKKTNTYEIALIFLLYMFLSMMLSYQGSISSYFNAIINSNIFENRLKYYIIILILMVNIKIYLTFRVDN